MNTLTDERLEREFKVTEKALKELKIVIDRNDRSKSPYENPLFNEKLFNYFENIILYGVSGTIIGKSWEALGIGAFAGAFLTFLSHENNKFFHPAYTISLGLLGAFAGNYLPDGNILPIMSGFLGGSAGLFLDVKRRSTLNNSILNLQSAINPIDRNYQEKTEHLITQYSQTTG